MFTLLSASSTSVRPDLSRPRSRCGLLPALTASLDVVAVANADIVLQAAVFEGRVNGNRISEQLRIGMTMRRPS